MPKKMKPTSTSIPFSKPYFTDKDIREINEMIDQILRSGWLTSGPTVQCLEREFADFIGTKYAVAVNSCTAALHCALLALKIKEGDEVIVPSNTFTATANVALYVGAEPVFADSDPETFNISAEDIKKRISKKTKAIIAVHLGGNPCDMREIAEIAEDNKLALIEDCAHAHGANYDGINCGSQSIAGCFSFYPTKIVTSAEGGILTTNDKATAEKIRLMRNHGRGSYGPSEIVTLGFNYRLSDLHAAVGLTQMKHVHDFIRQRQRIADRYKAELHKLRWLSPQLVRKGNASSYYAYIVKLTEEASMSRDELAKRLQERGIATSVLYHPVHLQPFYRKLFSFRKGSLPVAEELGEKTLALPIFNDMQDEQVERVVEALKKPTK